MRAFKQTVTLERAINILQIIGERVKLSEANAPAAIGIKIML